MEKINKNLFKLSFYSASLYNITRNVKSIYADFYLSNDNMITLLFVFFTNPSDDDKQYSYDIASTIIGDFVEIDDIEVKFYEYNNFIENNKNLVLFALAEN